MHKRVKLRSNNSIQNFLEDEKSAGIVLIGCTILSLWISNQGWGAGYLHFWQAGFDLFPGSVALNYPIKDWINNGLMAIFFLMVGLEIKREMVLGELAGFDRALLPVMAAIGGMAMPALIHYAFNRGLPTQPGIGIPMATDIAFSLGILALLGRRIPMSLKIFLAALAIIDDLGSVLLIAIFYEEKIFLGNLLAALGIFVILLLFNKMKIARLWAYLVPGLFMWFFMLKSGVHPTVSGVLLAFSIPVETNDKKGISIRLLNDLHKPVNFLILPIFALANTSFLMPDRWQEHLIHPGSLGISLGLVLGKPIGILLFCWLACRMKWGRLPDSLSWRLLTGAGILAGIGFTMSLFISNLAFPLNTSLIDESKIAVLLASSIAAIIGLSVLLIASWKSRVLFPGMEKSGKNNSAPS